MRKPPDSMQAVYSEESMVEQLTEFLVHMGYGVRREVPNMGQSIDLLATKGRWVTCIEAKLTDWKRALVQCKAHELVADFVCVAIASASVSEGLLVDASNKGYGVIHFDKKKCSCSWVLQPKQNVNIWPPQREHFSNRMRIIAHEC